jgi:hypothetical protein
MRADEGAEGAIERRGGFGGWKPIAGNSYLSAQFLVVKVFS